MSDADQQALVYPWLNERWEYLNRLRSEGRLPHALLLNGSGGIGKLAFARSIGRLLLCDQPVELKPCGRCRGCQLNEAGSHPDYVELRPDEPGKPIKIDQIRNLNSFIYSTAQQGGYRVLVMEPAEAMNISAANALLKMLEEPGENTLMVLVTHRLGQVMPTIKSRCQRIDCAPPASEMAVAWLATRLEVEHERAEQLLQISYGSPLRALDFNEQGLAELRSKVLKGLADILKQRQSVVELAQSLSRDETELILGWLHDWLNDIARVSVSGDEKLLRHKDVRNMLLAVAKATSTDKVFALADRVQSERVGLMNRQNPNKQLLLESILFGWVGLVR